MHTPAHEPRQEQQQKQQRKQQRKQQQQQQRPPSKNNVSSKKSTPRTLTTMPGGFTETPPSLHQPGKPTPSPPCRSQRDTAPPSRRQAFSSAREWQPKPERQDEFEKPRGGGDGGGDVSSAADAEQGRWSEDPVARLARRSAPSSLNDEFVTAPEWQPKPARELELEKSRGDRGVLDGVNVKLGRGFKNRVLRPDRGGGGETEASHAKHRLEEGGEQEDRPGRASDGGSRLGSGLEEEGGEAEKERLGGGVSGSGRAWAAAEVGGGEEGLQGLAGEGTGTGRRKRARVEDGGGGVFEASFPPPGLLGPSQEAATAPVDQSVETRRYVRGSKVDEAIRSIKRKKAAEKAAEKAGEEAAEKDSKKAGGYLDSDILDETIRAMKREKAGRYVDGNKDEEKPSMM
ncbi:hypothetical protein NpNSSI1_00007090 [Neofusicoccum parvum]|nr:hypothetical protein NpNSSI1_00007090 [Neofusicoccum parvum]